MATITNKQTAEDLKEIIEGDTPSQDQEEIEEVLGVDLDEGGDEEEEEVIEDKKDKGDEGEEEDIEEEDDEDDAGGDGKDKPEKPPTDFKKLYNGSTQEAIILKNKNDKFAGAVEEAKKIEDVSDEELRAAYPVVTDWEKVDPLQKQLMKESLINKKKFDKVGAVYEETQKVNEWVTKTHTFLEDEANLNTYPQLRGREDDFAKFCLKPSRIGADFEELVRSFSYDIKSSKHKGALFHSTSGGDKAPEKKQLTSENVKWLRENRPKKYRELLMAGKLKFD